MDVGEIAVGDEYTGLHRAMVGDAAELVAGGEEFADSLINCGGCDGAIDGRAELECVGIGFSDSEFFLEAEAFARGESGFAPCGIILIRAEVAALQGQLRGSDLSVGFDLGIFEDRENLTCFYFLALTDEHLSD
jgi:hypothetical protein